VRRRDSSNWQKSLVCVWMCVWEIKKCEYVRARRPGSSNWPKFLVCVWM